MTSIEARTALFRRHKGGSRIFIETGTYQGDGVRGALAAGFEEIHSFETSEKWVKVCRAEITDQRVHIHHGDSGGDEFRELLGRFNEPVLFWLDAHYMAANGRNQALNYPLTRELRIVCERLRAGLHDNILADDVRLWGRYGTSETAVRDMISEAYLYYEFFRDSSKPGFPDDVFVAQPMG